MKLLCSVLILAGVFALNDASIPFEHEIRLANDQKMLIELKRMPMERSATSLECSQNLIDNLTKILQIYNDGLAECNKTMAEELQAINEDAAKAIGQFGIEIQNTCETISKCESLDSALDSLICYEDESSESAKVLTSMSNEAASKKVELNAKIETCQGNEKICSSECLFEYSKASMEYNSEFKDCVNGKQTGSGGGSDGVEKPSDATTTEAPQESSTSPPPQVEEVEGEDENGGRFPKSAHKYSRW